ncbi:hypothetical protein [Candidatus Viridilinea mediisalina]|uniref:hypothetical protein n=1 Tax=Candidatus Viridilinea mediisalina TaxID=2024553 RepID=UPI001FE4D0FC|nr:hypothetical protein [Candidatus Viridilinea mediisalina]
MPITIALQRTASDRAAARLGDQLLATFEPAALLVDQPLPSQRPVPADPVAYGQRLFAALGGPAFFALRPRGAAPCAPTGQPAQPPERRSGTGRHSLGVSARW